jgi:hypothetical protein
MKSATIAALASLLVLFTQIQAIAATPNPDDYALKNFQRLGFKSARHMKKYFTIGKIKVTQVRVKLSSEDLSALASPPPATGTPPAHGTPSAGTPGGPGVIGAIGSVIAGTADIDKWVILGEKIWQLIVDNRPVANVSTQRVQIVPQASLNNWETMTAWRGPALHSFKIEATNLLGMVVMSHTYTVAFNYGGQYLGHGAFLANATVIPSNVTVAWGFKLTSALEVGQAVNTGSLVEPVPGLDLQVKWSMDSVLKHMEGRENFFVKGTGQVTQTVSSN